jgi:hypothetical protein
MLVMTGKLRQHALTEWEGKKRTKLWVETLTARDNGGADDLQMHELFLDGDQSGKLPAQNGPVSLLVRAYAVGKLIKFSCSGIVPSAGPQAVKA